MTAIRYRLAASAAALAAAALGQRSAQQGYPTKPITIVVPAAAGGPTDTVARLIGESMSRTLGQQIMVENVGGAGGTIGMARVAKAAGRRLHAGRLAHRPGHRAGALRKPASTT